MAKDKLISIIRENEDQSNFYRNKLVIEVNHAKESIAFWETIYTFDQIIQLIVDTPELFSRFNEILNDRNFKNEL